MLVGADENAADRRAHQHVRSLLPGCFQQGVEIGDGLLYGLVGRSGIAPTEPGAIERANAGCLGDPRLHQAPVDGERTAAGHQDHCRASLSRAIQVEFAPAYIDHPAGRRISLRRRILRGRWSDEGSSQHQNRKQPNIHLLFGRGAGPLG